jgi:hypothetical protein
MKKISTLIWLTFANCLLSIGVQAQSEWQSRNSIGVSIPVIEKLDFSYSHMQAFSITDKFSPAFSQHAFNLDYQIDKNWQAGTAFQLISPAGRPDARRRFIVKLGHQQKFSKITWTNTLRFETNSANERRFRQRIAFSTRVGLRKRLDFLNLAPAITYTMFYNIGGSPIRYYDENEQLIARQSPDGVHRSRLTLSLNSKVNDYLRITLYYMRQQEFNFLNSDTRKMNVYDPVRNRTLRPFDNFNTLGLSLNVSLEELIN